MKGSFAAVAGFVAVTLLASAQTAVAPEGVPALRFRHPEPRGGARAWQVDYVTLPDLKEPAFRIRVHHYHGWCNGYLYVTPTRIAYDPVFTPAQKDGFSVLRSELQDRRPRFAGYQFSLSGKVFQFAFLGAPDPGSGDRDEREALLNFVKMAVTDFAAAQRYFLATLTGIEQAAPIQPVIRVLDPPGVQAGSTADATGPAQSVAGVVAVAGGVRAITANGEPASVTPLSQDIAFFQTPAFRLPSGSTPLKIAVTANSDTQAELSFNAVRPEIAITQPAGAVRDAAVTLRGNVVGLHDIEKLTVAGKPAQLQQRPDGGFEFIVPNVPLEVGANAITGYAVQSDGRRQVFDAVVTRMPPQKPLTLQQIEGGLRSGVSVAVMLNLVQTRGVDFELTPALEKRLRAAGANDDLLDAINEALH